MTQFSLKWVCTIDTHEVFSPTRLLNDLEQAGVDICESFDERLLAAVRRSTVGGIQDRRMFHIYELLDTGLLGWQMRNLFPGKHHLQLEDMLQVFLEIVSGKTGISPVGDDAFRSFVHTNQVFFVDLWYDEDSEDRRAHGNLSAEGLGDDPTYHRSCHIITRAYTFEPPVGMRYLTELEYDGYGPGGPCSGAERPRWKTLNM